MRSFKRIFRSGASALFVLALTAAPMMAQAMPGEGVSSQTLRAYRFVFIAYTLCWLFVMGWVISVGRKLSKLMHRLED